MPELHAEKKATSDLAARVVRSGGWVFCGKISARVLQLIKVFILARLLSPEDFGLFGLVLVAVATLDAFTQTGFQAALIQREKDADRFLDDAWTIHLIRGGVLASLLFVVAPWFGTFFDEPRVVPLLRVLCLVELVKGATNIGIVFFEKELQFHKKVAYDLCGAVIALCVGVGLAVVYRNTWALVGGQLAGALFQCVFSFMIHPYRPRISFNRERAMSLLNYGRWMLGTAVVYFVSSRMDSIVIGKVVGVAALGTYQIGYMIANLPATEVVNVIGTLLLSTYAKIQQDIQRLRNVYLDVFEGIMALAVPLTVFLIVGAVDLVPVLLGDKWLDAVLPIQILAFGGLLLAITATAGPLFLGTGRPHMSFWMSFGSALVIIIGMYPLTSRFGIAGAAWCVVFSMIARLPAWWLGVRAVRVTILDIFSKLFSGLMLGGGVLAGCLLAHFVPTSSAFSNLLVMLTLSAIVCLGILSVMVFCFNYGVGRLLCRIWEGARSRSSSAMAGQGEP